MEDRLRCMVILETLSRTSKKVLKYGMVNSDTGTNMAGLEIPSKTGKTYKVWKTDSDVWWVWRLYQGQVKKV